MGRYVWLEVCCNDPDNGHPTGKVAAIQFAGLDFASRSWDWGPRITEGDGWVRIGGMKLTCRIIKHSVGNWCWNAYAVPLSDAERLVNWPKFRKWFDIESGRVKAFDRYRAGEPLRFGFRPRPTPTPTEVQDA